jgi:uncharacterized protein (DUF362 family)
VTVPASAWDGSNAAVGIEAVAAGYGSADDASAVASMRETLAVLCVRMGWGDSIAAPLSIVIRTGDRVVLKPNWVLHENKQPGEGFESLVTHGVVLRALTEMALATGASQVVVGDAPVQGCQFDTMIANSGLTTFFPEGRARDARLLGPVDFRRTVSSLAGAVRVAQEDSRDLSQYVKFDLGAESYLEPITDADAVFRVTQYPPDLMKETHRRGRHQYLVAKEILDADVVINVPKLKTHKKAGVTCALKNLVGINGNKEFLPHHRIGGPASGGDCYPENSVVKRGLEQVLDLQNATKSAGLQTVLGFAGRVLYSLAHRAGDVTGVEGAWSGNDTVWRMCLDLNRIIQYGRVDGGIDPRRQRRVINVVDAVIAGHGDGPLAPKALPLGLLMAGESSAAVDWISAIILGYDPARIPIALHAFDPSPWPLAAFSPAAITVHTEAGVVPAGEYQPPTLPLTMDYPAGWRDAVSGGVNPRVAQDVPRPEA